LMVKLGKDVKGRAPVN